LVCDFFGLSESFDEVGCMYNFFFSIFKNAYLPFLFYTLSGGCNFWEPMGDKVDILNEIFQLDSV
jgi:hypothetical protein